MTVCVGDIMVGGIHTMVEESEFIQRGQELVFCVRYVSILLFL